MADPKGERNVIGPRIRAARLMQNPQVSQEDLAARLTVLRIPIDRSAISRMEAKARFVRDYEIIAIARCLRMPPEWFFAEDRWDSKGRPRFGKTDLEG